MNKKLSSALIYLSFCLSSSTLLAYDNNQTATPDWPRFSYDFSNSNHNPTEKKLNQSTVKHLVRAWETFNDDSLSTQAPPTGFALESVLGLSYPNSVVGVTASPLIDKGTIYYVDQLGTVFARDAKTGQSLDPQRHWTTTLVDPDFDNNSSPVLPELYYSAPVLTESHIWLIGSVNGRLHAIDRQTGVEIDFDPSTSAIDPFTVITDLPFASVLGDSVIVNTGPAHGDRDLFITGINVIINDAVVQGSETGVQLALDITDPENPIEYWRRFSIDINPATNQRYGTGVSVGSGLAVDTKRHLIYGGTGQNTTAPYVGYPDPNLAPAGYIDRGDSLYAIDYLSGEFVWHNQFHANDIFNLNEPVSTGPNQADGPKDADVLSPPVLWTSKIQGRQRDLVGVGSKGGLYRVADRDTGATVWQRQISQPTGLGGIQAGSAYADGTVYVAGFEGIDDGYSDAQFGVSFATGLFPNAFFATFSPAFWADMEDISNDADPATGTRIKVYALNAKNGRSRWNIKGNDFVEILGGSALRHVSVANNLIFVSTSAGEIIVLNARNGKELYRDQTLDLNQQFSLGLGKPHHASMNTGVLISDGMVYTGYGAQNNPSGGMLAYQIDRRSAALEQNKTLQRKIRRQAIPASLRPLLIRLLIESEDFIDRKKFRKARNKLNQADQLIKQDRAWIPKHKIYRSDIAQLIRLLKND